MRKIRFSRSDVVTANAAGGFASKALIRARGEVCGPRGAIAAYVHARGGRGRGARRRRRRARPPTPLAADRMSGGTRPAAAARVPWLGDALAALANARGARGRSARLLRRRARPPPPRAADRHLGGNPSGRRRPHPSPPRSARSAPKRSTGSGKGCAPAATSCACSFPARGRPTFDSGGGNVSAAAARVPGPRAALAALPRAREGRGMSARRRPRLARHLSRARGRASVGANEALPIAAAAAADTFAGLRRRALRGMRAREHESRVGRCDVLETDPARTFAPFRAVWCSRVQ